MVYLEGLEEIDNIIALIKNSESSTTSKENLIKKYQFIENQAKAILAMRLSSLAELENKITDLKDGGSCK